MGESWMGEFWMNEWMEERMNGRKKILFEKFEWMNMDE